MARRERQLGGLLLVAAIALVAGGAVWLTQRFLCARYPDTPFLGWGCDSDPAVLAIVIGIAAGLVSLAGWAQSRR